MSAFPYCLNTSTIRPTPLLEKVRVAGLAGYEAIEPWNDEIDDYIRRGGSLGELKTALDDAGLKVVSMIALHSWVTAQGEEWGRVLDECGRRMDQAAALGSPFIVASPPREAVPVGIAVRRFERLARLGHERGVRPAMEFLGFVEGVNSAAAAKEIADGAGDLDSFYVADVFHMMRGPGSIDDLLALKGERLAIFHINDLPASPPPREQTDADRVMLGEGIADLPRVVSHLRTIGYRGPLSLELFNPTLWERDPLEVVRRGLDRIRNLVDG